MRDASGGADIARAEWYREGKVPLQTLRVPIDYGFAEAKTVYGIIGVKCWINRKEGERKRRRRQAAVAVPRAVTIAGAAPADGDRADPVVADPADLADADRAAPDADPVVPDAREAREAPDADLAVARADRAGDLVVREVPVDRVAETNLATRNQNNGPDSKTS